MTVDKRMVMSSFTYPWDLADIGVDTAFSRMRDEGFGALELTASYHPITLYNPGAPNRRLMYMEYGGIFFPARSERYGRILPDLCADADVLRAWPKAADLAESYGLDLNAWTVCIYQPWIARDYPDAARVTPAGYPNPGGVCPCNPDVQEFMATMVADLASQFPIRTVQLEGVAFPFIDAGWRMPRILIGMSAWTRWLSSLCFCISCVQRAKKRGVAVESLRARVCAALESAYFSDEGSETEPFAETNAAWLAADDDYAAFLATRDDGCVELVLGIAAALREAAPATALGIWGPLDFDGSRLDLERVIRSVQVLQTRQPLVAAENARLARSIADEYGLRVTAVQWCGGQVGPQWGPNFADAVRASVDLGIDQINLFNWAMIRPSISRQIVPLLRQIEDEVR